MYIVKTGDNLLSIARKELGCHTKYTELIEVNKLESTIIYPGQVSNVSFYIGSTNRLLKESFSKTEAVLFLYFLLHLINAAFCEVLLLPSILFELVLPFPYGINICQLFPYVNAFLRKNCIKMCTCHLIIFLPLRQHLSYQSAGS